MVEQVILWTNGTVRGTELAFIVSGVLEVNRAVSTEVSELALGLIRGLL